MAVDVTSAPVAESSGDPGGYQQELKRTLGSFRMFAISFAFISVAVGIFGTYDDVLVTGGPVGIWLWVLVAVGQTPVALVVAQFAAASRSPGPPTSGPRALPARRSAGGSVGLPSVGWASA